MATLTGWETVGGTGHAVLDRLGTLLAEGTDRPVRAASGPTRRHLEPDPVRPSSGFRHGNLAPPNQNWGVLSACSQLAFPATGPEMTSGAGGMAVRCAGSPW